MGLSASQGRMLLLTARKDDLEFRAQQISQRRLILSQELESISTEYEEATSDRQMKINLFDSNATDENGNKITVSKNLTYATLISGTIAMKDASKSGIQPYSRTEDPEYISNSKYRLIDVDGAIVISDAAEIPGSYSTTETTTKEYDKGSGTTPTSPNEATTLYDFAMFLTDKEGGYSIDTSKNQNGQKNTDYDGGDTIKITLKDKQGLSYVKYFSKSTGKEVKNMTDDTFKANKDANNTNSNEYELGNIEIINKKSVSVPITSTTTTSTNSESLTEGADGKYTLTINGTTYRYVIDKSLKYGSTDAYGTAGGPNYLQDCIRNGKYLIQKGEVDQNDNDKFKWRNLSWDAASNINDSYYSDNDDAAKAKYDRLQNQIQNQDKKLELELDNIETQRSAVKTEIDSVQKVMDDNIESTFKIFS